MVINKSVVCVDFEQILFNRLGSDVRFPSGACRVRNSKAPFIFCAKYGKEIWRGGRAAPQILVFVGDKSCIYFEIYTQCWAMEIKWRCGHCYFSLNGQHPLFGAVIDDV